MTSEEREELKETAREVVREKLISDIREPLTELAEKRTELKRLREKVDELKEVTGELSAAHLRAAHKT